MVGLLERLQAILATSPQICRSKNAVSFSVGSRRSEGVAVVKVLDSYFGPLVGKDVEGVVR